MSLIDQAKAVALAALRRRAIVLGRHYKRVFMPDGEMTRDAEIVIADLRRQCFWDRTTMDPDSNIMREREANRRLFLRIMRLLDLTEDQIKHAMEIDHGPEFID
jgi:hypothetical protein